MTELELDQDGFLRDHLQWDKAIAQRLAANENIQLTDAHWEIIECLRDFYQTFELSPAMRPLVKYIANTLGPDKGNSLYLMRLFPGSPAKLAAKIAGLPRPDNCL